MDTFVEKIVQKGKTPKVYAARLGILVGTILAIIFVQLLLYPTPAGPFAYLLFLPLGYVAYHLWGNTSVEYEYCITNAYIDVDKIFSRRRRKKVFRIDMSDIGIIAPLSYKEHKTIKKGDMDIVAQAVVDMSYDDIYYIVGKTDDGKSCLLYIHVDDRTREAFLQHAGNKFIK